MKSILFLTLLLSANLAYASSFNCTVWMGGFDPENEMTFSGNTEKREPQVWGNNLGSYEILLYQTLKGGQHPSYPLGLVNISFTKVQNGLYQSVYSAQVYPAGKSEGSFWAESLEENNLVSYRCFIE
jgi:hypothetical protein